MADVTRTTLRDGSEIEIRPMQPGDRQAVRDGFERLSPESRYRRFFGPMPSLSERDLDYLTNVDHHTHEALIARDPESGLSVGVARFVRTSGTVAEPAVAVVDDWQGRGVGTKLLTALVERAREEGIARFDAPVLAHNLDAITLLERLGETTKRRSGRELQLTIELRDEAAADVRWRRLLSQFAGGAVQPGRTVIERLWPRRPGSPDDPRYNVIVVGTDGSEPARLAVEKAGELAVATGARVEIVGVHQFLSGDASHVSDAVSEAARRLRDRGVAVGEQLRRGDPALVLTDIASEAQARLIVVGAAQRSKQARRILGSVSDYVAERSPCNVLIVRPRENAVAGA